MTRENYSAKRVPGKPSGGKAGAPELVTIPNAWALGESAKALFCEFGDKKGHWVPKSQIAPDSEVKRPVDRGLLIVPTWWAKKEGLLEYARAPSPWSKFPQLRHLLQELDTSLPKDDRARQIIKTLCDALRQDLGVSNSPISESKQQTTWFISYLPKRERTEMERGESGNVAETVMQQAAWAYVDKFGFAVFPCKPHGKEPLTAHGCKDASKDRKAISVWWKRNPSANIGIATGAASGVVVLDVDAKGGGRETLALLEDEQGRLPDAPTVLTGGGGLHIYFRDLGGLRNSAGMLGQGLDFRADGGYVIAPPSIHPNGSEYRWEISASIRDVALPEIPRWLLDRINAPTKPHFEMAARVGEGKRNETLFRIGRSLKARGLAEEEILAALQSANGQRCDPPLDGKEVAQIAYNAATTPDRPEFMGASERVDQSANVALHAAEAWPEPEPLTDALPAVKSLGAEMLPMALRDWLLDIAERYQAPVEYVAVPAIIAAGALIGRKVVIRPKRHDDWSEVPNLWGAVVGRPGIMKSPLMAEALKPLQEIDRAAHREFEDHKQEAEFKQKYATARRQNIDDEIRKRAKEHKSVTDLEAEFMRLEVEEPHARRYVVNDATVEKVGELLNQNPNGLVVVRDELGALLARLDSEEHATERGFFLQAWGGKYGYTYDRIARGTLRIEAACLSVIGAITPSRLDSYMRETFGGGNDDGLMQRFSLAVYPELPGEWKNIDREPHRAAGERARAAYQWLKELQPDLVHAVMPDGDLPYLRFDDDALAEFEKWREWLEVTIRDSDEHPALLSHLAKYRTLCPALALIFHLLDWAAGLGTGLVSLNALRLARAWCEIVESHARRIYRGVAMPAETAAAVLGGKLRKGALSSPFKAREIGRKGWSGLSRREDIDAALAVLEDASWVRAIAVRPGPVGGRPSAVYHVNPRLGRPQK
jgi:putative DNA primase/helicase